MGNYSVISTSVARFVRCDHLPFTTLIRKWLHIAPCSLVFDFTAQNCLNMFHSTQEWILTSALSHKLAFFCFAGSKSWKSINAARRLIWSENQKMNCITIQLVEKSIKIHWIVLKITKTFAYLQQCSEIFWSWLQSISVVAIIESYTKSQMDVFESNYSCANTQNKTTVFWSIQYPF